MWKHHRPYTMFLSIYTVTVCLWYWETGSIIKALTIAFLGAFLKACTVELHHLVFPPPAKPCENCKKLEDIVVESEIG